LRKTAGAGVTPPNRIKLYREKMEGVDLFDKLTGLYRIWIQSRKWFWLLFRFSLKGNTQICGYCTDVLTEGFHCWFSQDRQWFFARGPIVGASTGVLPQTKTEGLYVVRLNGKHRIVDKKCTETQRLFAACAKCTRFVFIKFNVGLHPGSYGLEQLCPTQTAYWAKNRVASLTRAAHLMTY